MDNQVASKKTTNEIFRRGVLSSVLLSILVGEILIFGSYIFSQMSLRNEKERLIETILARDATDLLASYTLKNYSGVIFQLRHALKTQPVECAFITLHGIAYPVIGEKTFCDKKKSSQARWSSLDIISGGLSLGPLEYTFDNPSLSRLSDFSSLALGFVVVVPLLVMTWILFADTLRSLVIKPLQRLTASLEDNTFSPKEDHQCHELSILSTAIDDYRRNLEQNIRSEAIADLARQVAHDIRSPLTALQVISNMTSGLPEQSRIMLREVISRISNIANNLSERSRSLPGERKNTEQVTSSEVLLFSVVESIVAEKRVQFGARNKIQFSTDVEDQSYGIFAKVNETELKRVLSNIINNAVEAIEHEGIITIRLYSQRSIAKIEVIDTGKGIPEQALSKVTAKGFTLGKASGLGLGLHHAKTVVESWRGTLLIDSTIGKGTTITIQLPQVQAPSWFLLKLDIPMEANIIILDDDQAIHETWKSRLVSILALKKGVSVNHFSIADELVRWHEKTKETSEQTAKRIYLIDYELIGQGLSGLDVIKKIGCPANSALVTSHYQEKSLQQECEQLHVRLLPKIFAAFVPIELRRV